MSKTRKLTFEQAMLRLDEIVERMESGDAGIEESITLYEEAMEIRTHCARILEQAEQRIQKIQLSAAGRPEAVPFDDAAPGAEPDAAADADA